MLLRLFFCSAFCHTFASFCLHSIFFFVFPSPSLAFFIPPPCLSKIFRWAKAQSKTPTKKRLKSKDEGKLRNSVLLVGPPGCGKTTAIYALAKERGFEIIEVCIAFVDIKRLHFKGIGVYELTNDTFLTHISFSNLINREKPTRLLMSKSACLPQI